MVAAVVMCRSDDAEAASPVCGRGSGPGGNGLVSGWIIFQDLDNSGQKVAAEPLLRVQSPIKSIDHKFSKLIKTFSTSITK